MIGIHISYKGNMIDTSMYRYTYIYIYIGNRIDTYDRYI